MQVFPGVRAIVCSFAPAPKWRNSRQYAGLLLLSIVSACERSSLDLTGPEHRDVGLPAAGALSVQGPVAGGISRSAPEGGRISMQLAGVVMTTGGLGSSAAPTTLADVAAATLPAWTTSSHPYAPSAATSSSSPAVRLLWQNTSTGDRSIWIMNGATWDGSYAALPSTPTAWSMVASADFNGDGNSDIVWQNTVTGDRSIWFMNNTTWGGAYAALPNVPLAWSIAGAGDFNNDGNPDLVWQNTTTGDRSVWFMNGSTWSGNFALLPSVAPEWSIAAVADFNADGKPDLVWQNTSTGQRSIWFMNGSTWSGSYTLLPTIGTAWQIVGAADFDGDNNQDLVWQNLATGERSIWFMTGSNWSSYALLPTVAGVWSIAGTLAPPKQAAMPDLMLDSMNAPANGAIGSTITVSAPVRNQGTAASGQFRVAFYYSTDATITTADTFSGGVCNFPSGLAAGATAACGGPIPVPTGMTPGTYYVGAIIDDQSQVTESNENNNARASATTTVFTQPSVQIFDVSSLRAAIAGAGPNSQVNIPPGVYDLGNTGIVIQGKTNLQILGAGRGQTIIRAGPSAAYVFELAGTNQNLTVAHLSIEGATTLATNTHGLASGFSRLSLLGAHYFDLDIKNVAVGISVVGSGSGVCTGIQINDNYLDNIQDFFTAPNNTSGSGYGIHNDGCTDVRISGNTIRNADRHSIYQARGYQPDQPGPGTIVIENNLIIDHAQTSSLNNDWLVALVVARSSNVVVANNVVINPYHDALSIENVLENGQTYVVNNVRLIGNTVLGARGADVFFNAAGNFTSWGNKYYHRDATGVPSTPFVRFDTYSVNGNGNLVEPSAYPGTQGLVSPSPFTTTYFMQANLLQSATNTYNADPSTWSHVSSATPWSAYEDMTATSNLLYVVNNRRIIEVNPATQGVRPSGTVFPARSMIANAGGNVVVASNGQLWHVDLTTLASSGVTGPGAGPLRGMAAWGSRLFLLSGGCDYELNASTLTSTQMSC
ncbi:MAG: FG-GAP-like repeat-containing protein [Gemmatimonadaceae bacterium]